MKTGIELIAEERKRQVEVEGFTDEHDKQYDSLELVFAAITYAIPDDLDSIDPRHYWPWDPSWYKRTPNDRVRELSKAGALIAAEIDRLQNQQS